MEYNFRIYVAIIFYVNDKHNYANIKNKNKSLISYYKNIISCFNTAKLTNKDKKNLQFVLFTNLEPINPIITKELKELGVNIEIKNNTHLPPAEYCSSWQGTFFYIDALQHFRNILNKEDVLILTDPDCIFLKPISNIVKQIQKDKILNYLIKYPEDFYENGLSRLGLKEILDEEKFTNSIPNFFGGEFYGFGGEIINDIYKEVDLAWDLSLNRFKNGKSYFRTEEHIFSYVFAKKSVDYGNGNIYIKRIWTAPHYNNVSIDDLNLAVWHLPAEKERGLLKLYKKRTKIFDLNIQEYPHFFGRLMGIPHKSISRAFHDLIHLNLRKIYYLIK